MHVRRERPSRSADPSTAGMRRAVSAPGLVLALQRTAGNASVVRLLRETAEAPPQTAAPFAGRAEFLAAVGAPEASAEDDRRGVNYLETLPLDGIADVVRELWRGSPGVIARLRPLAPSDRVAFALDAGAMRGQQGRAMFEAEHTREVVALSGAEPDGVKAVLQLVGPESKEAEEMKACPGYLALTPDERTQLTLLVGGSTPVSRGQGPAMRKLLDDARADKADPETFRRFLGGTPSTGNMDMINHRRLPDDGLTIVPGGDAPGHPYRSGAADAVRTTAEIRGQQPDGSPTMQSIEIFFPKAFRASKAAGLPSAESVAQVLAETPYDARARISRVDLHPRRNRDDAFYNREPGYAHPGVDFRSFMTAGADGVVDVFPQPTAVAGDLEVVESALLHESGHIVSIKAWGADVNSPSWAPWREASAKDGAKLTKYATASPYEDFAEAWSLFVQAHRKPRESEVRALMPHRFAIMASLVSPTP